MPSQGTAEWQGDLQRPRHLCGRDRDITGDYSFKSRFEDGTGRIPEQLIGAAHAACFYDGPVQHARRGGHARRLRADHGAGDAEDRRRHADHHEDRAAHRRSGPGHRRGGVREQAEAAKAGCPVSRALAGVPEITLEASLAG